MRLTCYIGTRIAFVFGGYDHFEFHSIELQRDDGHIWYMSAKFQMAENYNNKSYRRTQCLEEYFSGIFL